MGAASCGTAEAVSSRGEKRVPSKLPPEAGKWDDEGGSVPRPDNKSSGTRLRSCQDPSAACRIRRGTTVGMTNEAMPHKSRHYGRDDKREKETPRAQTGMSVPREGGMIRAGRE